MDLLEPYLAFSEAHRGWTYSIAAGLATLIALLDWRITEFSLGFLYIVPILMTAPALRGWRTWACSLACAILREQFSTMHGTPGTFLRIVVATAAFALAGYFVSQLDQKRQLVARHLEELQRQVQLRRDAEHQLRVVIETSPLAILTLDSEGRLRLTNESARHLLRLNGRPLLGEEIESYMPILKRFLAISRSAANLRTTVESRGQRADGEPFLAHVWLSTFTTNSGPCLAAFIWDASENLRDREGKGLDSMMAVSRIVVGAVTHEIRNLAAAAALARKRMAAVRGIAQDENFETLGTIIEALQKIANSGLHLASHGSTAVADLSMVLDETRVVIDAPFREVSGVTNWKIGGRLPLVQGDHHGLLQVFLNLARNSYDAMKDTEQRVLSVEAGIEDEMVLVRFRDTGPGVANPDTLFSAFQPGASSTGLGLYISRAMLRSYGGDLWYEPKPDSGCFVVQLWPAAGSAESPVL